jgi:hypothetical protein
MPPRTSLLLVCLLVPATAAAAGFPVPVPASPAPAPPASPATPAPPAPAPGGAPAAPAPAQPPSSAKLAEARLHFQQGVALYKEANYDAALAEFQAAYAISAEPVVLYNMGLTEKALFRYAEAVETLDKYLAESAARNQAVTPARRIEVTALTAEMRSLLADVTLVIKPADAAVRIDGRPVAVTGIEGIVKVAAGTHVIDVAAPDHAPARRDIVVVAGTPQQVAITLAPVPRTGRVRITAAQIGARVDIDGRALGPAPVELDLLAGGHQLDVNAPGFAPRHMELVVAAGQSRDIAITLDRPAAAAGDPFYNKWWFWTGAGVAAAAVATILLIPAPTQEPLPGSLGLAPTDP